MTYNSFDDRTYRIEAGHYVTYSIAGIALILRFVSRHIQQTKLWWDDYLIVISFGAATGFIINGTPFEKAGLGRHISVLGVTEEALEYEFNRRLFIADILYSIIITLFKLSMICFYWRIFSYDKRNRIPLGIMGGCSIAWFLVRIIIICVRCTPTEGFWNKYIDSKCGLSTRIFYMCTCTVHTFIDVCILSLPMFYIRKLKVSLHEKIGLGFLFAVGGFVVCTSIVTLIVIWQYKEESPDMTWNYVNIFLWAGVENNTSIISACLPSLRPIYLLLRTKVFHMSPPQHSVFDTFEESTLTSQHAHPQKPAPAPPKRTSRLQNAWTKIWVRPPGGATNDSGQNLRQHSPTMFEAGGWEEGGMGEAYGEKRGSEESEMKKVVVRTEADVRRAQAVRQSEPSTTMEGTI